MTTTLMRTIDELTDAQKAALVATVADSSFFEEFDAQQLGVKRLRAMIDDPDHVPTREDVIQALNWAESVRIIMHVSISMIGQNVARLRDYVRCGACAYCQWTYRDELAESWDGEREITQEEIDDCQARITAAIREHVVICSNHPMRALELEAELREATAA